MLLSKKKIIIIGGGGSLGQAAVRSFIEQGAEVIVADQVVNDILFIHPKVNYLKIDATEESDLQIVIHTAHHQWGSIDGLYHIAGGSGRNHGDGPLHEMKMDGWQYTLKLNLTSVMISNKAVIQYWLEHKSYGSIVNVGSVLAFSPAPHFFTTHAYAAAKAGIEGFSKSIASYYSGHNIRINVISPGLIATNMSIRAQQDVAIISYIKTKQPLDGGRIGAPEDCVGAALYLLSDLSSFVTGQVIAIDGGWELNEGQW